MTLSLPRAFARSCSPVRFGAKITSIHLLPACLFSDLLSLNELALSTPQRMAFSANGHQYGYTIPLQGASGFASTSTAASGPTTRSRTGLFLSYRDTVIRSTVPRSTALSDGSTDNSGATRYPPISRKGKGRARYDDAGEGEETSGLLGKGQGDGNGHAVVDMTALPPKWCVIVCQWPELPVLMANTLLLERR